MGEYALVTAAMASLAVSIATIPEGKLAARLPTTAAKARVLVVRDAKAHKLSPKEARAALARAPYKRAPLRYLYVAGWLNGRARAYECVLARAAASATTVRLTAGIRGDRTLVSRLGRMKVTATQAARALVRGAASAC